MNIAIVYGGESTEHDISIVSSVQLIQHIGGANTIVPIYISNTGTMYECKDYKSIDKYSKLKTKVTFVPNDSYLYRENIFGRYVRYLHIDFVYIVMHGRCGEDGVLASILDMSHIPYSSADIVGSAVCIDKAVFKNTMFGLGVNIVPYVNVLESEYDNHRDTVLDNISHTIGYPLIVKPSTLGSSIGIQIFNNEKELVDNIKMCFSYDEMVVVEKYIDIDREINIALFKYKGEDVFSEFEVPSKKDDILSFQDKYMRKSSGRMIVYSVGDTLDEKIKDICTLVYDFLRLSGVVRFDYILDKDGILYLNELNTIPGSMANYLYKGRGIQYTEMLDMLKESGLDTHYKKKGKVHSYSSGVLNSMDIAKLGIDK